MFEWNLGHHFLVHELIFNGLHDSSYTSICYLLIHSFLHLYNIKSCMPTLLLPIPSDSVIFFFIQYIGVVPSLFLPFSIFKTKYFFALSVWKNEFTLMLMHVHEIFLSCYNVHCWGQECFAVCVKKNVFLYSVLFLQIFFLMALSFSFSPSPPSLPFIFPNLKFFSMDFTEKYPFSRDSVSRSLSFDILPFCLHHLKVG